MANNFACICSYVQYFDGGPWPDFWQPSYMNIGWLHWYGVVCWALLRPILLSSVAPYKVHGALAPSVPPIKVFSVYHLHAPPPGRNVPLQWLVPQFGMASLCLSAHSLELF